MPGSPNDMEEGSVTLADSFEISVIREVPMRCLRIYATPDRDLISDDVDIPPISQTKRCSSFRPTIRRHVSASCTFRPAWAKSVGTLHRQGGSRYDSTGVVKFETDGEVRHVSAGGSMMVEDTHGKSHISRHPKRSSA